MSPALITKLFEREARPWPLPNHVTESICLLAGREASVALYISLGRHTGASVAHKAAYHEPFTYWDWHGVEPDDTYAREWKKQRIWEHQRGFVVNGTRGTWPYGYPSPRKRWQAFKREVEDHLLERRYWVKSIAVAHWMDSDELNWCVYTRKYISRYTASLTNANVPGLSPHSPTSKD
jgi:hypothetical protein